MFLLIVWNEHLGVFDKWELFFSVDFSMGKVHMELFSISYLRVLMDIFIIWEKSWISWVLYTFLWKCEQPDLPAIYKLLKPVISQAAW